MAALTVTYPANVGGARMDKGLPTAGRLREVTFSVSPGNAAADEWADLSAVLRSIHSIVGFAQTAGTATAVLFKANALGTGGADSPAKLGVRIAAASTTLQITVRGFPR